MQTSSDQVEDKENESAPSRDWGTRVFLCFLAAITCFYAVILFYHTSQPPGSVAEDDSILERCRQICLKYGLVSTGDVRQDAENYLAAVQSHQLTDELAVILADKSFSVTASQPIKLLDQPAPEFSVPDETSTTHTLNELNNDRPLVVVFYLGYGCSHCVAQLLALDKDLPRFRELDAEIVAISSDSPEHTAEKFAEFGRFSFPVLSDIDYSVAEKWGVYEADDEDEPGFMSHGTFVVDRTGKVIWGTMGPEPFLDNRTLLHVIAESQGMLPSSDVAQQQAAVHSTASR
ncbi:MAG: redoxin domain-containing protein [Planctomycetaceae bacterium]|nr:redoxin domain-containing protein [Planctomycetaceae bacterium]